MSAIINAVAEAIKYFVERTIDEHGFPINKEHCETALKALYKANKVSPILYDKHYFKCPYCKEDLGIDEDSISIYDETPPNYCNKCGQALDWRIIQPRKDGADNA